MPEASRSVPSQSRGRQGIGAPPTADDLVVHVMLAEYQSLRQESANAIVNRITIVSFTLGALALTLAGLVAVDNISMVHGLTALLFLPWIPKTCLLIWLGEYERSQRAGYHLWLLERRINSRLGVDEEEDRPLSWEYELREGKRKRQRQRGILAHMHYPYTGTILLLLAYGWAASTFGIVVIGQQLSLGPASFAWCLGAAIAFAIAIEVTAMTLLLREKNRIRNGYSINFDDGRDPAERVTPVGEQTGATTT